MEATLFIGFVLAVIFGLIAIHVYRKEQARKPKEPEVVLQVEIPYPNPKIVVRSSTPSRGPSGYTSSYSQRNAVERNDDSYLHTHLVMSAMDSSSSSDSCSSSNYSSSYDSSSSSSYDSGGSSSCGD